MGMSYTIMLILGVKLDLRNHYKETQHKERIGDHDYPEDWNVDPKTGEKLWRTWTERQLVVNGVEYEGLVTYRTAYSADDAAKRLNIFGPELEKKGYGCENLSENSRVNHNVYFCGKVLVSTEPCWLYEHLMLPTNEYNMTSAICRDAFTKISPDLWNEVVPTWGYHLVAKYW